MFGLDYSCDVGSHIVIRSPDLKTNPCFRYEGKTGKECNLVIFKCKSINNRLNGELSTRPFDMVVDRFIFILNYARPLFYLHTLHRYGIT